MLDYLIYFEIIVVTYFIGLNGTYLTLIILSFASISNYMQRRDITGLPHIYDKFALPVSILVPAYNEEESILETIQSLSNLDYPEYEIIIINDGSTDRTLDILKETYNLIEFPEAYRVRIPSQTVHNIYHSTTKLNLRVIDKKNGDRADALNAGINIARYPLFCCVDADCVIQHDSLSWLTQPFFDDPAVVACGGTIRVSNNCGIQDGKLTRPSLSWNPLVLFQTIEYLRSFLFGRMGWTPLNAHMIISGAFGIFHKETVVSIGGFHPDALGEDMELVMRLHRELSKRGKPYHIHFIPDPICWTDVPHTFSHLQGQRIRWHKGHIQALKMNIGLLFNRKAKAAGMIAFPFSLFFECLGPIIEFFGYIVIFSGFFFGFITLQTFMIFFLVAIGLGILLSVLTLLLEEISFHLYPKPGHVLVLFFIAIIENFGYRQLNTLWRVIAAAQMTGGAIKRLVIRKRQP